jgi:hypothetical protein
MAGKSAFPLVISVVLSTSLSGMPADAKAFEQRIVLVFFWEHSYLGLQKIPGDGILIIPLPGI